MIIVTSTECMGFFFFNDTATTEIYTLSLHDALPISDLEHEHASVAVERDLRRLLDCGVGQDGVQLEAGRQPELFGRSEEHTSELQSRQYLVCRLLLEKKKHIS